MDSALSASLSEWRSHSTSTPFALEVGELQKFVSSLACDAVHESLRISLRDRVSQLDTYASRLWKTISLQLERRQLIPSSLAELKQFISGLKNGHLYYGQVDANVLHDIVVAQGLELYENEAAREFERGYMPQVRAQAHQFAGPNGVEAVDNLAADLVIPRGRRAAKIATFRGLTPLKSWLRSVVINRCVSLHRGRQDVSMNESHEIMGSDTVTSVVAAVECEEKLAPAFSKAVSELPLDDRVLLKMLVLDGVPQNQLAAAYRVDPGTLTRRKQKAATGLLAKIRQIGVAADAPTAVRECLELLLAGESRALQMRLSGLLAVEIGESVERNT